MLTLHGSTENPAAFMGHFCALAGIQSLTTSYFAKMFFS